MNRSIVATACVSLVLGVVQSGLAESTSTPPGGYVRIIINGTSDNSVAVPLAHEEAAIAAVTSIGSNTVGSLTAQWDVGQWAVTTNCSYYCEFVRGSRTGFRYPILDNLSDTLIIDTLGTNLVAQGGVGSNDVLAIRRAWTIGEVFGTNQTSLILDALTSVSGQGKMVNGDGVLLPDNDIKGIFKAPKRQLYFYNNQWTEAGSWTNDCSGTILLPGSAMTVRRLSTTACEILSVGDAPRTNTIVVVQGGTNDNLVAIVSGEPQTLAESNLGGSVVAASPSPFVRMDELLMFSDGNIGFGRPPQKSFIYVQSIGWCEAGSSIAVGTNVLIEPGKAYLLRKRDPLDVNWIQQPNY